MRSIRQWLFACALLGLAGTAAPADPQNGVDYLTLPQAQNTDSGTKVEVTEFFAYYCPHCHVFESPLAAWVKKQGAGVSFKRVHVSAGPGVLPQQRLFYTLEAMGLLEQYHAKVFSAMHQERLRLNSDEQVAEWAAGAGIDPARFANAYRSFGVEARLRRVGAMMDGYRVDSWPMIAVGGRFLTSPSLAGQGAALAQTEAQQQQATLLVLDYLVDLAKAQAKALAKAQATAAQAENK